MQALSSLDVVTYGYYDESIPKYQVQSRWFGMHAVLFLQQHISVVLLCPS